MLNVVITPKYDFKKCLNIISTIFDTTEIQYCNNKICSLWGLNKNLYFPLLSKNHFQVILLFIYKL